jgi:hypothetical protein
MFEDPGQIKKNRITDSVRFSPDQESEFFRLIGSAKVLTTDPHLYKLSLLLTLTRQADPDGPLAEIHGKYTTLATRRLRWMSGKEKCSEEDKIEKVFSSLADLAKVADILRAVTGRHDSS